MSAGVGPVSRWRSGVPPPSTRETASVTGRQVFDILLVLALLSLAYLNEEARERLVTNLWQPVPAFLMTVRSP